MFDKIYHCKCFKEVDSLRAEIARLRVKLAEEVRKRITLYESGQIILSHRQVDELRNGMKVPVPISSIAIQDGNVLDGERFPSIIILKQEK